MNDQIRSYLGSRTVWIAAVIYVLSGNLATFSMEAVFSTDTAVLAAGILSPLLLTAAIYYLKNYRSLKGSEESLTIAFTFASVLALTVVFTVLGSVLFAPSMIFMNLSSLMLPISLFLTATGVYYLLEVVGDNLPAKELVSILLAGFLAFTGYTVVLGQQAEFQLFIRFVIEENLVSGLLQAFLMLSAVTLGLHRYTEYSKKILAVSLLSAFGIVSQGLSFAAGYITRVLNPAISGQVLLSLSWESLTVALSGLTYYMVAYLDENYGTEAD